MVRAGNKSSNVKEFYRYGATTVDTGSVVGLAFVLYAEALASARYLKISDGSLRIDRGERIVSYVALYIISARSSGR